MFYVTGLDLSNFASRGKKGTMKWWGKPAVFGSGIFSVAVKPQWPLCQIKS